MQYYPIPLTAGIEYTLSVPGRYFLVDEIVGASSVDITLLDAGGSPRQVMPKRKVLFKCVTDFGGVVLKSAADCTVSVFVSYDDVHNGYADGGNVSVPAGVQVTNTALNPVHVDFAGVVAPVVGTINNTDAQAIPTVQKIGAVFSTKNEPLSTITNFAPVVIGTVAAALVSDATQKKLRIRNSHATAILAIGGAGVTLANAAVQLQPGDIWTEDDAAGAAWYAISDTAATTVQIQGLK